MKHLDLIMFIVIFTLIPFWIYMAYKIDGCTAQPKVQPEVELLFELCGNGAPLVKDGEMYMVVCIPMNKR
jgi:hypothetical protein